MGADKMLDAFREAEAQLDQARQKLKPSSRRRRKRKEKGTTGI